MIDSFETGQVVELCDEIYKRRFRFILEAKGSVTVSLCLCSVAVYLNSVYVVYLCSTSVSSSSLSQVLLVPLSHSRNRINHIIGTYDLSKPYVRTSL